MKAKSDKAHATQTHILAPSIYFKQTNSFHAGYIFKYKREPQIYKADTHQAKCQHYRDYKIQHQNHIPTNLSNHEKQLFHLHKQRNHSYHIHQLEQDY
jgi:hypothetical protein